MYRLEFKASVKKDFKHINLSDITFIKDSLNAFVSHFSMQYERELLKSGKIKKLQGEAGEIYRLRLRSYRVIYLKEDNELVILVVSIKSRENSRKK